MASFEDTRSSHAKAWEERVSAHEIEARSNPWRKRLKEFSRNKLLFTGSILGVFIVGLGLIGPLFIGSDYGQQALRDAHLTPFSEGYLLGTDQYGRDLLVRLCIGIRVSLFVAAAVTSMALVVGMALGMCGGFLGGSIDRVVRSVTDFVWGFPLILVAVLLAGGLGQGLFPVILAVGIVNVAAITRVVRGEVVVLRSKEFVEAARACGVPNFRIMWRHLMPNVMAPALVLASYYVAVAIIAEAGLSFIGLGAQPPLPSLGKMVADGRGFLRINHWESTVPGIAIALLVLSVSLIGDGLRDVFDPQLRHEAKGVEKE
ncbi:MAG TPA: ABC transporter permease [Acidimicrobiaceae bacterium]|nr:ABC transporter permease [Acidimicrobiaceae bacterium]|tara:strand:+ start:476 stop:1423 length:948 start_codon:yes stop_codon:yes gene_type:complete